MARRRASAGDRNAIATCAHERYPYAKAAEQRGGRQARRDHEPLRRHRTGSGLQSPAAVASRERAQLAAFVDLDSVGPQALRQAGGQLLRAHEAVDARSEEHTSELQSHSDLVCRLLLEKKKKMKLPCLKFSIQKIHK